MSLALGAVLGMALAAGAAEPQERVSELLERGRDATAAVRIGENVLLAPGTGNAYLVLTPAGSVLIDTGLAVQAAKQRKLLLDAAPDAPVRAIVLTHSHADHIGGARLWKTSEVPIYGHRLLEQRNRDHVRLEKFRDRRARILWQGVMPEPGRTPPYPQVVPDIVVDDIETFDVGGVEFAVIATPGGEGPDAVSVWVPSYGALFTGDALGPTLASFPNLFTMRGENLREAVPMIDSLIGLRELEAEWLLPGHFDPVQGKQEIRALLTRTVEAVRYVHDETVKGMNEGKDLWTLMREIAVPPELQVSEQYGRVAWGVRAIWESYTGWFRYESTTELYATPPSAVYPELGELVGADVLARRAQARVEAGEPVEALHLTEVALAAEPGHRPALQARLDALVALSRQEDRSNFQLAGWLRHRIAETQAELTRAAEVPQRTSQPR
jgi:glyoxylase-like metal-dependent hydrolase (beta-lactamase superfamily II)